MRTDTVIPEATRRPAPTPWVLALVLVLGAAPGPLAFAQGQGVVTATVAAPFDRVVTRLRQQVAAHKLVVVKEVPYQKMLAMVGAKTPPMLGLELFHPRYGKRIYEVDPSAFKEAPLRVLVRTEGRGVVIEYRKPSVVFGAYPGLDDLGRELDEVFADIVKRVAG